ncbi:MAG: DNA repair exonuclease [Deferrisomatales bacterium]
MRFVHTSDWQLGLKLRFVAGEAGARARAQRFDTVREIARVARERRVDAVVVAGDVFDDNAVGADTLQQAHDALAAFAPIVVLLLPGNHDAATPDAALGRLAAQDHVRVLAAPTPVEIAGGVFHPCPLTRRHEVADPTRHLEGRDPGDARVRVAVAHGGVVEFGEDTESPNRIDVPAVLAKGFDYLALGDWHSVLGFDERAWYAGTPEPTRFSERDPGQVLVVEIPRAGAPPRVEPVRVARTRWLTRTVTLLEDEDVDALGRWFEGLEEKSWTLACLELEGQLSLGGRARLETLLREVEGRLLHLRIARDGVVTTPSEADLAGLTGEGFVGRAVERLREEGDDRARDALLLLYRLRAALGEGTA